MMRQEDFSNRLTCWFSLYSCLLWLKNRNPETPWEVESIEIPKTGTEKQTQEDEEVRRDFFFGPKYSKNFPKLKLDLKMRKF